MADEFKVLVVNEEGVPGTMFDAFTYDEAVEIIHAYCKHYSFDVSEWSEVIEGDGYMELPDKTTIYIVSSEPFSSWLAAERQ